MRPWVVAAAAVTVACGSTTTSLQKAGTPGDEGDGVLGKLSMSLVTEDRPDDDGGSDALDSYARSSQDGDDTSQADPDEPVAFGGQSYGGTSYAGFYVRPWLVTAPVRTPDYSQVEYLKGTLEGTIRWTGAVPATLTTACGPVTPMRVGPERGIAGVVVYIEEVTVGRMVVGEDDRVLAVGGTVVLRGCSFAPPTQVMAPVPAAITVYGDRQPSQVRIQVNGTDPKAVSLEAGGHTGASVEVPGYSRVDGEDGTLGAAFVVGVATQYYAVTDARGHFRIDELAPGTYTVTIWQAPLPKLVGGTLAYGKPIVQTRKVTIPKAPQDRAVRLDLVLGR